MLEPILKETYGVIIYQEQVMQIAQVMAGYSLGEADLLRRAMGKKDKAEMAKQQARFVEGAMQNGVKKGDAVYIFELVDKFAGYGFNKSHAAAYAVVSYHTAYLKANFREEFFAASMTLDMANTDKLAMFAAEARQSGHRAFARRASTPPDVEFLAEPPAGEGQSAARSAMRWRPQEHRRGGRRDDRRRAASQRALSSDLADFARRLDPKALNKRALETLAMAGAFDALERNRALVHGNVDQIMDVASRLRGRRRDRAGQPVRRRAGDWACGGAQDSLLKLRPIKAWTPMERLQHEFAAVGFYLSGHPLDAYATVLPKLGVQRYADSRRRPGAASTAGALAGIVISARERSSQKGNNSPSRSFRTRPASSRP